MHRWMRPILTGLTGMTVLSTLTACGATPSPTSAYAGSESVNVVRRGSGGTTRFLAKNLMYRLDPNVSMFLTEMNADVVLKDPTMPFVPANKTDYSLKLHHAIVEKDAASLQALMNNYVFNDSDSPLRNLKISFSGNQIVMNGQMKQGAWVPFEMKGTMSPTADGLICLTPTSTVAAGLPVQGLMNFFHIEMQTMMKTKEEKGVLVRGNNILMDPARLYPPPKLLGKVSAVAVRNGHLHIEFDDGAAQPWPALPVANPTACMCMIGGDVLINSALNLNAKFEILDSTPNTPMVFALDRYREQLEAGYVVPTKDGAMIAYSPDVNSFDGLTRFAPSFPVPDVKTPAADPSLTASEASLGLIH